MSNINDIDEVLNVLKKGTEDKNFDNIEKAVERATAGIPTEVWGNFPQEEKKGERKTDKIKRKSIGPFKILKIKAKFFIDGMIDDIKDTIKTHITETLVSTVLILGLMTGAVALRIPNIRCNKFGNKLKEEFEARNYKSFSASQIIDDLGIGRSDYFRIYLLSYGISNDIYNNILNELGYNSLEPIAKKEGYEHTEYERATELLKKDYELKLQEIIEIMHKNPEVAIPYYCDLYPELIPYIKSENELSQYLVGAERGLIK